MESNTFDGKAHEGICLKVEITTTQDVKASSAHLLELEGNNNGEPASPQIAHLSIVFDYKQLPLGGDEEGRQNSNIIINVLSRLASSRSFITLSLSAPLDTSRRLDWRTLDSSSPGQDLTSALSLQSWAHVDPHHLPNLRISGLSQVPAEVITSKLVLGPFDYHQTPSIRTLTLGATVKDITNVPFHRKVVRSMLKEVSIATLQNTLHGLTNLQEVDFVFLDGYNIGSESLKYHATQFIEMFRDVFQRPGYRTESFNRRYPNLRRVRIVIRRENMNEIGEDEMTAFREVASEIGVIGEGTPLIHISLEDVGSGD
ncbi:hypothetical protein BKA70DRAFT_1574552 [Coprinopsis sp. MPI-PUGE-AT-0042]|nr:hypothetical protein BKA70DRAFT_1574552 [Coprinopsis sp. MPI-PUGE-AT-0042]